MDNEGNQWSYRELISRKQILNKKDDMNVKETVFSK